MSYLYAEYRRHENACRTKERETYSRETSEIERYGLRQIFLDHVVTRGISRNSLRDPQSLNNCSK